MVIHGQPMGREWLTLKLLPMSLEINFVLYSKLLKHQWQLRPPELLHSQVPLWAAVDLIPDHQTATKHHTATCSLGVTRGRGPILICSIQSASNSNQVTGLTFQILIWVLILVQLQLELGNLEWVFTHKTTARVP